MASVLGLFVLLLAVVLAVVFPARAPRLPPGLSTPILAFEFARTADEVEALFGPPGSAARADLVRAMNLGNSFDYAFMLVYGAFLFAFAAGAARAATPHHRFACVLSGIAVLADAFENLQLFAITAALGGDYAAPLARLLIWTWLKWGSLAFYLVWFAPWLLRGGWLMRTAGAVSLMAGLLAVPAAAVRGMAAELFGLGVSLAILLLWLVALSRRNSATVTFDLASRRT